MKLRQPTCWGQPADPTARAPPACGPPAAPTARAPPACGLSAARAARTPRAYGPPATRATRSLHACGEIASPAAHSPPTLRHTCRPLQPASRHLQPARRPCALPACCMPCAVRHSTLLACCSAGSAPPCSTRYSLSVSSRSIMRAWLTRDAAAHLAIRSHLPLAECAHFGQHKTAKALYDALVARYSSPATAALGHLILPYLFPELSAFATAEDLLSHLRTSNARYRAALPAEFLDRNPPPMYITLYFILTRLPDSLRAFRDHFLALDPTDLTADLLEQHLLAAETSVVAVGAAPCTPFFEGCSPSPLAPSYASAAAVGVFGAEDVGAASASGKRCSSKGKGGRSGGGGSGGGSGGGTGGGGGSGGGGSGGSGGGSGVFGGDGGGDGGGIGGSGSSGSGGCGGSWGGAVQGGGSFGGQQQSRSETPSPLQLH
ncbi:unnamed protein product [Closterium sp. NIES-54]